MPDAGPVLIGGDVARAVANAILEMNEHAVVVDRGGYLRVSAPGGCRVTRAAIEAHVGRPFELPRDLEAVMPSFSGRLRVTDQEARWE